MEANEVLIESFGRVSEQVHGVLAGIDDGWLTRTPVPGVNPIGWLIWHIARGQDIQIAMLVDGEQEWVKGNWAPRFGLEPDPWNMGYGHTPERPHTRTGRKRATRERAGAHGHRLGHPAQG